MKLRANSVNSEFPDTANYHPLPDVNDAYFELNASLEVVYASPAAPALFSRWMNGDADTTCERWSPIIGWLSEPIRKALDGHQHLECECYDSAAERICQLRIYLLEPRILLYIRDITELKHSQLYTEQRIHSLFDHNPDAVYTVDPNGRYQTVNASSVWITGYTAEELENLAFANLIIERDFERTKAHFRQALQGYVQHYPVTIRRKDGTLRNLHITNVPIRVDEQVTGILGIAKDMTMQHMTEALLRKSIELLADAQKTAHVGSWEVDQKRRRIYWSDEIFHIFGLDPAVDGFVSYDQFLQFIHPSDRHRIATIYYDWLSESGKSGFEFEYRICRPNGEERSVRCTGLLSDKAKMRMGGSLQDITLLRQIERQLSESEQRFRSIVNHHPDGVCAFDMTGLVTEVNPAFERISGYTSQELKGMSYVQMVTAEEAQRIHLEVVSCADVEKIDRLDSHLLKKDGTSIPVTNTLVPIIVNGQRVGTYSIVKDITEQLETNELFRKSDKLKVVGQLAAAVAHEIRNPLTALKGFIKLIHTSGTAINPEYFKIIQDELSRIELISSELLVLAKPQAGRIHSLELQEVLEQTIVLLSTQAIMSNIEIVMEVRAGTTTVRGDSTQLKQIFVNLLKNAIEAMHGGGTILVALDLEDAYVRVRIQDEGCGMPEDIVQRLGEPFYTTKEKGTGLGFMVTKRIIEAHQGHLQIRSVQGQGTTIDVFFPSVQ
ncbi:two-component system sporulation sensor kinase A [Paenibacillus phyllosphaerae]|uniref:histidine kinase n=1 Tax=Paenibacillus phyllosphaerae TaxID=274593 RepID=A0A7W5AYQ6_9BACL|nr:PAS domain S-box protein [Paenibacillus phyllosphaerae]MBB3111240.1 two-component system sporulation sensor kinase A [Paenibacillus phyllosphaerae]